MCKKNTSDVPIENTTVPIETASFDTMFTSSDDPCWSGSGNLQRYPERHHTTQLQLKNVEVVVGKRTEMNVTQTPKTNILFTILFFEGRYFSCQEL
jgi:hypothetical protein